MHNRLSKNGKKVDKIKRITVHYYKSLKESTFPTSVNVGEDSDESDSDNDLVLYDESESEYDDSDDDSNTVNDSDDDIHTVTRSGRRVRHWSTRYADFVQLSGLGVGHIFMKIYIGGGSRIYYMGLKGWVTFFL